MIPTLLFPTPLPPAPRHESYSLSEAKPYTLHSFYQGPDIPLGWRLKNQDQILKPLLSRDLPTNSTPGFS